MKRLWLICALAAICAGCVAKQDQKVHNVTPEEVTEESPASVAFREPMPLLHKDWRDERSGFRTDEESEANLQRFSDLAKTIMKVEFVVDKDHGSYSKSWDDPQVVSDVRWAFSGNLSESMSFTSAFFEVLIFHLQDGSSMHILSNEWWTFFRAWFDESTFNNLLWTPEMEEVIQSIREEFFRNFYRDVKGK